MLNAFAKSSSKMEDLEDLHSFHKEKENVVLETHQNHHKLLCLPRIELIICLFIMHFYMCICTRKSVCIRFRAKVPYTVFMYLESLYK